MPPDRLPQTGHRPGDHPGQGAAGGEPPPVQAQQHHGTEGGTKPCPSEGHQVEDRVVGLPRHGRGNHGDQHHRSPAHPDADATPGVLAENLVQVLDQRRRRHQQLRRDRRHDRGQDRGDHETGDQRVEEQLPQRDEHGLRIVELPLVTPVGRNPDQGGSRRPETGQNHPADPDPPSGDRLLRRAQRHEPHDDVRLPKVPEPPGQRRDHSRDRRRRTPQYERIGVDLVDDLEQRADPTQVDDTDQGHEDQGRDHHQALDGISPGDGQEPAEEGVEHDAARHNQHPEVIVHAEGGLEESSPGHHAAGDVEGEENERDDP